MPSPDASAADRWDNSEAINELPLYSHMSHTAMPGFLSESIHFRDPNEMSRGGAAEGPAFPETPTISPLIAQGGRRG